MLKIAIIIGGTRPGRKNEAVAKWAYDIARRRRDAEFELLDPADLNLAIDFLYRRPAIPMQSHIYSWTFVPVHS